MKNRNGISKESVRKLFSIEKTKMNGFAGFVEDSEFNLFKKIAFPENLLLAIMLQDGAKLLTRFVATARDAIH